MRKIRIYSLFLFLIFISSCEDYLDKDPDSTVNMEDSFVNFMNFQGFVEEIYNCIPNKEEYYETASFNWGDDEIMNTEADWHLCHQIDIGNFWGWQAGKNSRDASWLDSNRSYGKESSSEKKDHRLWPHAWYCIRKCNIGLMNLDKLVDATIEEKNLIEGQLYFFRAWWHFELMQWFGGLPYVDYVLDANNLTLPRLTYQECADKAAMDFRKAADLLPIDWDNTDVGKQTLGKNQLRINKIMALGYLGKNYLWAGSPLMKNGPQLGAINSGKTYDYDTEYCKKAADAFGELLSLVEGGQTQYALAEFNYSDIYNHKRSSNAKTCYSDIFYTIGQNWLTPGSVEAIFRGPASLSDRSLWSSAKTWGPKVNGLVESDNVIHQPTANYVNLYGMKNGYPLDHENSGFSNLQPFKDRDPRFYHDIVFDGFKYVNGTMPADMEDFRYSELFTGGNIRNEVNGSRTGYFTQKLAPHTCNKYDKDYNWSAKLKMYLPYMRLADIYLMYAEACAAIGGASAKSENFSRTAADAIKVLRDRVGMSPVPMEFQNDRNVFIDEVRRERAVELAFEGFRFNDLQRWLLLTEYPYNIKTSQEFNRVHDDLWYKNSGNDPRNAQVDGWSEKTILTRYFGAKHYWLPLKVKDTYLYIELSQNPGW